MRAYETSPSWKVLGNLGLSAFKIERFGDGIDAYERYLQNAGDDIDPEERRQIERDLKVMHGSVGVLRLNIIGAAHVVVEDTRKRSVGGPIVNVYEGSSSALAELRLAAGKHTLVVSGDGMHATVEVMIAAGKTESREVELVQSAPPAAVAEPQQPSNTLRTTGLVIGGVGVAALIGGGVTAVLGFSKKKSLDEKCNDGQCPYSSDGERQAIEKDQQSLRTLGALTTGLAIGGGVLTAAGVTLYVVGGPRSSEKVALTPILGPSFAGLSAEGTF